MTTDKKNSPVTAPMWWDGGDRAITAREKALIEEHGPSSFSIPLLPQSAWALDAEQYGSALNEASWLFVEQCPEKSALLFNSIKVVLRAAILRYAALVQGGEKPAELAEQQGVIIVHALADAYSAGAEGLQFGGVDRMEALAAALAATGKQQVDPAWSLHDRVEFALRDAGFDFDEASRIALQVDGKQQVGEVQGDAHVLVLREMRARLTDAGSPARTSALDAAISALAARQPGAQGPVSTKSVRQFIADRATNDEHREDILSGDYDHTAWFDHIRELMAALASRQPGAQEAFGYCADFDPAAHEFSHTFYYLAPGEEVPQGCTPFYAAPPAQGIDPGQARVIEMLLAVAETAYTLADNSNDMEDCENLEYADFVAMSDALDALDELPDDQPGYTMSEPAKARWALRALIDQRDAAPGVGS